MKKRTRLDKLLKAAKNLESNKREIYSCAEVRLRVSKKECEKYNKTVSATYHSFIGFTFEDRKKMSISKLQLARQLAVLMYREMIKTGVVK